MAPLTTLWLGMVEVLGWCAGRCGCLRQRQTRGELRSNDRQCEHRWCAVFWNLSTWRDDQVRW